MVGTIRIGLVGDYHPEVVAHEAIPKALELVSRAAGVTVEPVWLPTASLEGETERALARFSGLWCVPGSPYESMEGALRAIRYARESGRAFLGTCGGFQHAIIEYARNVLGLVEADHEESNPGAVLPLISRLACSLVETSGTIRLSPGSRVYEIYGAGETTEKYHCNFGLNPHFQALLEGYDMMVTGFDEAGEVRIVEIDRHPFFFATLFQPERSALEGAEHPLVGAFVSAAADGCE